jgi:hypothetical protein
MASRARGMRQGPRENSSIRWKLRNPEEARAEATGHRPCHGDWLRRGDACQGVPVPRARGAPPRTPALNDSCARRRLRPWWPITEGRTKIVKNGFLLTGLPHKMYKVLDAARRQPAHPETMGRNRGRGRWRGIPAHRRTTSRNGSVHGRPNLRRALCECPEWRTCPKQGMARVDFLCTRTADVCIGHVAACLQTESARIVRRNICTDTPKIF